MLEQLNLEIDLRTGLFMVGGALTLLFGLFHVLLHLFTPRPIDPTPAELTYTTTPSSKPSRLPSITSSSAGTISLSVVVPAYNERERLGVMIDEVVVYLEKKAVISRDVQGVGENDSTSKGKEKEKEKANDKVGKKVEVAEIDNKKKSTMKTNRLEKGVEILVVDDGSSDGTSDVAREIAEKYPHLDMRVIRLDRNRGKGGAVQHGVIHSRGDLVLFADADGASRFADLDFLLRGMDNLVDRQGHGIVIGSRAHLVKSEAVVKRSKIRNFLMHGFHLFLRTLGVDGIRDTQCGFKLFTRQSARLLFPGLHLTRWSFDVELLLLASLVSPPIPVLEIPIEWHEVNGSKIRLASDSLGMARDLLVLRAHLFLGNWVVPKREKIKVDVDMDQDGEQVKVEKVK